MTSPTVPAIEFRGVRKTYGDNEVIRGVNLTLEQGKSVVICGPSGSGKSTLIRMVNRLEAPSAGTIIVNGVDSTNADRETLRHVRTNVGFVFQQLNLYPHLSALGNVTLALRKALKMPRSEADARALETLARVGLADKAGSMPSELSGGQQQRVAIARALATRPEVLLFDEPTSALDPEMIGEVLATMKDLAHGGITMVVVTHEMGFARTVADRVVFIDDGRVEEDASSSDFFDRTKSPRAVKFLGRILSPLHGEG